MKLFLLNLLFIISLPIFGQVGVYNYTYNSSTDVNYIDYDQIQELTQEMYDKNDKSFDESEVQYLINLTRSDLPSYTPEEIHKRMQKIPTTLSMKYTPEVGKLIDIFAYDKRGYMTRMMTLSQDYFPIFESVLSEKRMPMELKYLPIVESALNPEARSRCGATGLWQFMYRTAKQEGFTINTLLDERKDIHLSTIHAADYLQKLHSIYNDWYLALAAYNAGPGNVNKALKQSGGYDFWTIKAYLPRETQNYVPSFIAMVYLMTYHNDYKIMPGKSKLNLMNTQIEKIYDKTSLRYIAELSGMNEYELKKYNPALIENIVPATTMGYNLVMPSDNAIALSSKKGLLALDPYISNPAMVEPPVVASYSNYAPASTLVSTNETNATSSATSSYEQNTPAYEMKAVKSTSYKDKKTHHKIRSGETLISIADKYDMTVKELAQLNHMTPKTHVQKGKSITVIERVKTTTTKYVKTNTPKTVQVAQVAQPVNEQPVVANNELNEHVVQKGESLLEICKKYNVTLGDLTAWNNLSSLTVKSGQVIKIKSSALSNLASQPVVQMYSFYKASPGDTLQIASAKLNIPVEVLKSLNNIDENVPLNDGEKIKIPIY